MIGDTIGFSSVAFTSQFEEDCKAWAVITQRAEDDARIKYIVCKVL